ncbi:MAG: CBS domain-containing protein [Anaerovoracaceae bacterium]|nr:CBS domain-containing protein [Anaerovoracaceae bacterium]
MLVKDIMTSSVISVNPEDDYERIRFLMRSEDIGIVPVCDSRDHILGVITDRDMLTRQSEGKTAGELMTSPAITVDSGDDIHQAALKFSRYAIRRLPVTESGRLAGMLTFRDMAKKKVLMTEIGHIIYNICNYR